MVPSLIESVKIAGLVLAMDASGDDVLSEPRSRVHRLPKGVDGILRRTGVLKFNEVDI